MSLSPLKQRVWSYYAVLTLLMAGLAAVAGWQLGGRMRLLDGFVYDFSLTLTDRRPGATGPDRVAVIALDGDSLDSDELAEVPRVFLSPRWAKIITALAEADARAIGFDIIFSYAASRFPAVSSQYDAEFLNALRRSRDRLVLARSSRAYPADPFAAAVFDPVSDVGRAEPAAIAYAELTPDSDGVFRRLFPQVGTSDGGVLTTLSGALLARAKVAMPPEVLLAPARPLEAIPTYRLIDVLHCIDTAPSAIRETFAGRVVLIGTTLPEEDRKPSPDRFMAPLPTPDATAGSCPMKPLGASDPGSATVPGMFIHAAAIQSVLNGTRMAPLPAPARAFAAAATAIGGAVLGLGLSPVYAVIGLTALVLLCLAAAPLFLGYGFWFPAVLTAAAAIAAMIVAYVVRFLVEERRRRRVQQAFGYFLAPTIVDQLVESEEPLRLGGETRDVTIMFADLSGFTALSGKVGPEELMRVTNSYLGLIVEAVEASGGYIDKFIGDAVMGIWGAPVPDPDHASAAAHAALQAVDAVMRAKAAADARHEPGYAVKIGLNSGPAVIGNVGAAKRYNYTAVGETVNIASRLESVPGDYACRIVLGPATAAATEDRFVLNELDWVKVKGKEQPLAVYELVAERAGADPSVLDYPKQYAAALALYRAARFGEAEDAWRAMQHPRLVGPSPPVVMAERAASLRLDPPVEWDGVFVKATK